MFEINWEKRKVNYDTRLKKIYQNLISIETSEGIKVAPEHLVFHQIVQITISDFLQEVQQ